MNESISSSNPEATQTLFNSLNDQLLECLESLGPLKDIIQDPWDNVKELLKTWVQAWKQSQAATRTVAESLATPVATTPPESATAADNARTILLKRIKEVKANPLHANIIEELTVLENNLQNTAKTDLSQEIKKILPPNIIELAYAGLQKSQTVPMDYVNFITIAHLITKDEPKELIKLYDWFIDRLDSLVSREQEEKPQITVLLCKLNKKIKMSLPDISEVKQELISHVVDLEPNQNKKIFHEIIALINSLEAKKLALIAGEISRKIPTHQQEGIPTEIHAIIKALQESLGPNVTIMVAGEEDANTSGSRQAWWQQDPASLN